MQAASAVELFFRDATSAIVTGLLATHAMSDGIQKLGILGLKFRIRAKLARLGLPNALVAPPKAAPSAKMAFGFLGQVV